MIFEKFYRVGDELRRSMPGTGLGLYIVRRLVEQSGGTIAAQSGGPEARRDRHDPLARARTMTSPAKILIVDDEAHLAEGIRENLEAEGYETEVAHDGRAGLERIRARSFDLVLLDVMMPNMDGLELCAQIRSEGLQTPVLFLTVKGDAADRVRGFEAGGDDYLAKPFHLQELLLRVAAILRRSSWYQAQRPRRCSSAATRSTSRPTRRAPGTDPSTRSRTRRR